MEPQTLAAEDTGRDATGQPETLKNYIGGEWVESAATDHIDDVDD